VPPPVTSTSTIYFLPPPTSTSLGPFGPQSTTLQTVTRTSTPPGGMFPPSTTSILPNDTALIPYTTGGHYNNETAKIVTPAVLVPLAAFAAVAGYVRWRRGKFKDWKFPGFPGPVAESMSEVTQATPILVEAAPHLLACMTEAMNIASSRATSGLVRSRSPPRHHHRCKSGLRKFLHCFGEI